MNQLPKRTGVTDLTEDQLLLFDFFWDCYVPRRCLDSESYSIHMNVEYTHCLSDEQIDRVLGQLLERELICCRENSPNTFTLTPCGGALWEAERKPDWGRYISERGSHNERRLSLVSLSETVGRCYIGVLFSAGLIVPTERIKSKNIGKHWLTPWKRVADARLLRVKVLGGEQMGFIDWSVYESGRTWWRSVAELDTLKPNDGHLK
jgi:hypothetical protein